MKLCATLLSLFCLSFSLPAMSQTVRFTTNVGSFDIALNTEKAPVTVANFLRYVEDGSYKGTLFHRVMPDFMAQAGGYDSDYKKRPTYANIENESKNGLSNRRGTIAMARTQSPHSANRQFFINVVNNTFLDGSNSKFGYAVFGEVTNGIEIVDTMTKRPTQNGPLPGMQNVPRQKIIIEDVQLISE